MLPAIQKWLVKNPGKATRSLAKPAAFLSSSMPVTRYPASRAAARNSRAAANVQKLAAAGSERDQPGIFVPRLQRQKFFIPATVHFARTIAHRASRAAPKTAVRNRPHPKSLYFPILFDCRLARSCATRRADGSGGFFRQRPPLRSCSRPVSIALCDAINCFSPWRRVLFLFPGAKLCSTEEETPSALHPHIVQDMQMMIDPAKSAQTHEYSCKVRCRGVMISRYVSGKSIRWRKYFHRLGVLNANRRAPGFFRPLFT